MGLPWVVRGLLVDHPTVAHGPPVGCPWEAYGLLMKWAKQDLQEVQKSHNVNIRTWASRGTQYPRKKPTGDPQPTQPQPTGDPWVPHE